MMDSLDVLLYRFEMRLISFADYRSALKAMILKSRITALEEASEVAYKTMKDTSNGWLAATNIITLMTKEINE